MANETKPKRTMKTDRYVRRSKLLSFVLRHRPEHIKVTLDEAGWIDVDVLIAALRNHGTPITNEELAAIVATSDKQRFAMSDDGRRIRANQGHSVDIELGYTQRHPPERLFHGTAQKNLDSIREEGLVHGNRHHVHLSLDYETAVKVGQRHGAPVVLVVRAEAMYHAGHIFYVSDNGVWLTDHVPPQFLEIPAVDE